LKPISGTLSILGSGYMDMQGRIGKRSARAAKLNRAEAQGGHGLLNDLVIAATSSLRCAHLYGEQPNSGWIAGNTVDNHRLPVEFHPYGWAEGPCVTRQ
jgi:hypothetical protein